MGDDVGALAGAGEPGDGGGAAGQEQPHGHRQDQVGTG